jgi:predicted transcriptional regulator
MDTPDNPDLRAKRELNCKERFLRELDKGIAAADLGRLVDHAAVRKMIDERYPG